MRPVRTTAIGLALAFAATVPPGAALAESGGDAERVPTARLAGTDGTRGERARTALEAVAEAFAGGSSRGIAARQRHAGSRHGRQLTMLLRDLRLGLDTLDGAERDRAEGYLARPTGTAAFPGEPLYGAGANPTDDCTEAPTPGSNVCVHWATATADAPALADTDADGVPNHVEATRDVLDTVWRAVVTKGGYRAPRSDLSSPEHGPDGRLDVYLADIGDDGLYGYCSTDDPATRTSYAVSAYCVLDDDFATAQYGGDPRENLQVTAAHEFFHAVQFAYDCTEDGWLLEGTAAWVEDELYDEVDDNHQYLARSPLGAPSVPLDYASEGFQYGNWVFWRYLTERFPDEAGTGMPLVIREVVRRAGGAAPTDPGLHSTQALTRTLQAPLPAVLTDFSVANRRPASFYEEGAAYPVARPALDVPLGTARAKTVRLRTWHLTGQSLRVLPGSALTGRRWKLRVGVAMPTRSHGYAAAVTTITRAGRVSTEHVRLQADGDGVSTTVFGRRRVEAVEVTLTNGSVRSDCWASDESPFACRGLPEDDDRPVSVTVKAFRRL